jgi:hypothetical protein
MTVKPRTMDRIKNIRGNRLIIKVKEKYAERLVLIY